MKNVLCYSDLILTLATTGHLLVMNSILNIPWLRFDQSAEHVTVGQYMIILYLVHCHNRYDFIMKYIFIFLYLFV